MAAAVPPISLAGASGAIGLGAALKRLLLLLRGEPKAMILLLLVNLVGAVLTGIGDPLALKLMIDSLSGQDLRRFLLLALLMVVVYSSFRGVAYLSSLLTQRLRNRICASIATRLISVYYRLPYEQVRDRDQGYFVSRLYDEPARLTLAVNLIIELFSSSAICLLATGVCFFLSWRVTGLVLLLVPLLIVISRRFGGSIREISKAQSEAEAQFREGLGRAIESYKTVRVFDLHAPVLGSLQGLLSHSLGQTYRRVREEVAHTAWTGISLSTAETLVMVAAGFEVLRGNLSVGGLFAFVSAYWRVVNSLKNLVGQVPMVAQLAGHLERIQLLETAAVDEPAPARTAPGGAWRLRGLGIAFEGKAPLLQQLDLGAASGRKVLLVGPNGSGKSTLAHVLTGFLDPRGGQVDVPGLPRTSALLTPFGFVPGTLRDNLSHALTGPVNPRIQSLLGLFELEDKLDRDPASFSEGEKKKAQILMTLAKEADLYVFDEPLASIDPASKELVMKAIFSRVEGRSLLMILHGDDQYRDFFDQITDLGEKGENPVPLELTA